ncbi:MAG: DUF4393 domain-containing protein [Fusobacteriaceae bacterium]
MSKDLESVKEIINSEIGKAAVLPAANEAGKIGGIIVESLRHMCLDGIEKFNKKRQYGMEQFEKELSQQISLIAPENLQTPNLRIVGEAIEELKYSIGDDDIRKMFVNLLASASNKKSAESTHISFSKLITQLEPDEAKILDYFNFVKKFSPDNNIRIGKIDIKEKLENGSFRLIINNFSYLNIFPYIKNKKNIELYLSNLKRLNLIEMDSTTIVADERFYLELEEFSENKKMLEDKNRYFALRGMIKLTALGSTFCEFCCDKVVDLIKYELPVSIKKEISI